MQSNAKLISSITARYREAGNPWPATPTMVSGWAFDQGLLDPLRPSAVALYSRMIHQEWQRETFIDAQGRKVRKYHAARVTIAEDEELSLWTDIESAPREFMLISLGNRREGIIHDCAQLKRDADSYNENHNTSTPIQISLDFTRDVQAIEACQQLLDLGDAGELRELRERGEQLDHSVPSVPASETSSSRAPSQRAPVGA